MTEASHPPVVVPGVTYPGRAGRYRVDAVRYGPLPRVRGRRLPDGAPFSLALADFEQVVAAWPPASDLDRLRACSAWGDAAGRAAPEWVDAAGRAAPEWVDAEAWGELVPEDCTDASSRADLSGIRSMRIAGGGGSVPLDAAFRAVMVKMDGRLVDVAEAGHRATYSRDPRWGGGMSPSELQEAAERHLRAAAVRHYSGRLTGIVPPGMVG